MNVKLKEKIRESLSAVLPITGIVLMLSIFVIPMELGSVVMFLTGALMLIVGMGFFQLGAEMAMTPLGEGVGVQISKMKKLLTVLLTGFLMGVIITVSEPDLQVLAGQVPSVPNMVLIMTVNPGFGGQKFIPYTLQKVRDLKKMIDARGLKTDIEVDGGVNLSNVEEIMSAGANIIVAGSAVFNGDVAENTQMFLDILNS